MFRENQNAMREVNAVMSGQVLEAYADRMIAEGMERRRHCRDKELLRNLSLNSS